MEVDERSPGVDPNLTGKPPDHSSGWSGGPESAMALDIIGKTTSTTMTENGEQTLEVTYPPLPFTQTSNPQSVSYAGVVTGRNRDALTKAITWTPVGESDLITGTHKGEPALSVSESFKTKLCIPWQRTLIVRGLGLRINYITFSNKIRALWRPSHPIEIWGHGQDCFLVKLSNELDYLRALTEGP
ncbi:unnamed protein product [Linum trigynum]|uniref:DUF4283 domain-containing protein n=1 Tax=Linum trigynum TaxID=586398 RepID=A0AAV2GB51_9ROSI